MPSYDIASKICADNRSGPVGAESALLPAATCFFAAGMQVSNRGLGVVRYRHFGARSPLGLALAVLAASHPSTHRLPWLVSPWGHFCARCGSKNPGHYVNPSCAHFVQHPSSASRLYTIPYL